MGDHDQEHKKEKEKKDAIEKMHEAGESIDDGQEKAKKLGKLVNIEIEENEHLGAAGSALSMPGDARNFLKEASAGDKAAKVDDYSGMLKHDVKALQSGVSVAGGGAKILSAVGVDSASGVAAAAGDAVPVVGALAGGVKLGNHLGDVASSQDYARDKDGHARFGTRSAQDGGGARTRMDNVVDDAKAGSAAVGGGTLGKVVAVNNAAVSGVKNGLAAIPDALGKNPQEVRRAEMDATETFKDQWQAKITADHASQMTPAPTQKQLGQAAIRLGMMEAPKPEAEPVPSPTPAELGQAARRLGMIPASPDASSDGGNEAAKEARKKLKGS